MKQLLIDAKNEIADLRRRNEILEAQMGIVEVFAAALGLRKGGGAVHPDVAWQLQQAIDSMDKPAEPVSATGGTAE